MAFDGEESRSAKVLDFGKGREEEAMLTEAEDHDIASNDDGLAIKGKSASTPAHDLCLREPSSALPGHLLVNREPRGPGRGARPGCVCGPHSWRLGNAAQRR